MTDGKRFYGAKSMSEYRAFAGRDASRLFVTGMQPRTALCRPSRLTPEMPSIFFYCASTLTGEWDAKFNKNLHDVTGIGNSDVSVPPRKRTDAHDSTSPPNAHHCDPSPVSSPDS